MCTIEYSEAVDTPIVVTGTWRRAGELLSDDNHVLVSDITPLDGMTYQTNVTLSPLSNTQDSGQYSCEAAIGPQTASVFIIMSSDSDSVTLNVEGKLAVMLILYIMKCRTLTFFPQLFPLLWHPLSLMVLQQLGGPTC